MPELPEVETLRRGLERYAPGRQIVDVIVANAKVLKGQPEAELRDRIIGTIIGHIARRGKYLLFTLTPDVNYPQHSQKTPLTLCVHLKMRGQLLLEPITFPPSAYHCVSLIMSGRSAEKTGIIEPEAVLRFYDMWTWGELRALTEEELSLSTGLATMGPEPLEQEWDGQALRARIAGRRTPIKTVLLDQKIVAGVGNIYADESLFRCGLQPERAAASLTEEEAERLAASIKTVLKEAIAGGGTESEEYVDLGGMKGRYSPRVYDRGGEPCPTCGLALTKIRLGGRGTVFCRDCQS